MSKIEAVRKVHFCAGHRVLNHESKCANAHGHNYVAWFYAEADAGNLALDSIGRVIEFSVLKEKIGGWIDQYWDHTFLINFEDNELFDIKEVLSKNKPAFICGFNPTAEEMAKYLLEEVCPMVLHGTGVSVKKVELYETENCKVEVSRE